MSKRLNRLRSFMAKMELDGLVIAKPENRLYFSGFTGSSGLLLIEENDARLLTDFRYVEQAAQQAPDFAVVRHGSDIFEAMRVAVAKQKPLKLGFEGDFVTWDIHQRLAEIAGQLVPVHLDQLRMEKDPEELASIRRAVQVADDAFSHILTFLKPGLSENEVALALEFHMRKNGAEKIAFDMIVASGKRGAFPHGRASEKIIERGDLVTMDFGAVCQGYHSDITRTVVMGKASAKQREIYEVVLSAQLTGVAAVLPGNSAREVDMVARKVIADAGYADFFGHGLGHGLGLAIHEEPRLSPTGDTVLAEGMVVTVEPGIYLPDWGGVRIEDTVVVSTGGREVLTASAKELIELDW